MNNEMIRELNIPIIEKRDYWFVRTDSGDYFDDFYNNDYVAIGWDYLTKAKVSLDSEDYRDDETLKKLISLNEGIEINDFDEDDLTDEESEKRSIELANNKRKVTKILNKVKSFVNNLKVGDIIVIPSASSTFIAIGLVSREVYEDPDYIENFLKNNPHAEYRPCPYSKRVAVKWYKKTAKSSLDIYLQSSLKAQQAIFSLNEYSDFIDRSVNDIFVKDDLLHSIIRTNQDGNISLSNLKYLIDFLYEYINQLSHDSENRNNLSPDDIQIKLNIHSPGIIEVIAGSVAFFHGIISLFFAWHIHKYGGKLDSKLLGKLSFETKGIKSIELEQRELDIKEKEMENKTALEMKRLEIIENLANDKNFAEKVDSLNSLNVSIPEIGFEEKSDQND